MSEGQKSLIIWDDFRAHATDVVISRTNALDIVIAEVPKNLTHLLTPLDLTVNKSLKSFEQREFSKYYSEFISSALQSNPDAPIENTKVDVRLSVCIKPLHAKTMAKARRHTIFCYSLARCWNPGSSKVGKGRPSSG